MVSPPLDLLLGSWFYLPMMLLAWRLSNSSVNPPIQYISVLMCGSLQIIEHFLESLVILSTQFGIPMWLCLIYSDSRVLLQDWVMQWWDGRCWNAIILYKKFITFQLLMQPTPMLHIMSWPHTSKKLIMSLTISAPESTVLDISSTLSSKVSCRGQTQRHLRWG